MAVNSCRTSTELLLPKKWKERSQMSSTSERIAANKVPVVYYLSRNGQLEHPHFVEVPLSTSDGLYLRDVMNRLNSLRGNLMACMYSWSSKRNYKNGYVWQDLSEDDLIHPTDGCDYILKGSERLASHCEKASSSISPRMEKNQSWSSFDHSAAHYPNEYRVHKCESSRQFRVELADVATQTEEKPRRSRNMRDEYAYFNKRVELSREDLSPPSMSSSECVSGSGDVHPRKRYVDPTAEKVQTIGRNKASRVLMQLITCRSSSVSVKDYGPIEKKGKKWGNSMRMRYGPEP